jgi:hypothetical protein
MCPFDSMNYSFRGFDTVTPAKPHVLQTDARLVTLGYMSVTELADPREQHLAAVDTLVNSRVLHGSESLCKLLRYLADQTLQNPGVPIKEYQIATEVFGRPADFDPHVDSAIRVQAGRLRVKLAEYYASEGAQDPISIELPKGSYALVFHHQPPAAKPGGDGDAATDRARARHILRNWSAGVVALSLLVAGAVAALVGLWVNRAHSADSMAGSHTVPAVFQTFWKPFLSGAGDPWVIFSNAAFVGRPETGMRYRDPAQDMKGLILDHYTGVGEVLAVHELDRVFYLLHRELRVKRGSLFSLDDAKNNDLIFVGSPAENLTLRDLPSNRQFVFRRLDSGPQKSELAVFNVHPLAGEPAYFVASPSAQPLTEDYAVVALEPGINPSESVMILAGTTTIGTQAAVEFVCREDSVQKLLSRLNVPMGGEVAPFEAVLRVKVARGVPVETVLVAFRKDVPTTK